MKPDQTNSADLVKLLDAYAAAPAQIAAAVEGMTRDQLLAHPVPGKWSALEVVAHLADAEQVYADRMKRIISMDKPLLIGFDPDRYIARLVQDARDVTEELAVIRINRAQMVRILQSQPPAAWDRQGVHNERGLLSLRELLESMVNHVNHHLSFVVAKRRALGL